MGLFLKAKKEKAFWDWFRENATELFHFEQNQSAVFGGLSVNLRKVNPDLAFEIGPEENGSREFVISANGVRTAFAAVEALYAARPELAQWRFTKFRPRREDAGELTIGETTLNPEDLRYLFAEDDKPSRLAALIMIKGFEKAKMPLYAEFAYLFLDGILGEYDVETWLGAIEIQGFDSEYFEQSHSLETMAADFDEWKRQVKA